MEHSITDYLFILDLYPEGTTLDTLLFHIEPGGTARPAARAQALQTLAGMEQKGLVALDCQGRTCHVRLTALGRQVSAGIADVMAEKLVKSWRNRPPRPVSTPLGVANF